MAFSSLRTIAMNWPWVTARSDGGASVTKKIPVFTLPPKPPTTAKRRSTSGRPFRSSSAFRRIRSVSRMSELTAVWQRMKRRLWSCDGTNSPGSVRKTTAEAARRTTAATRIETGRARPQPSARP